ncbi:MAG: hypothetical protein H8F28_17245 [Fibrella sp.]|nr:hypothetical protein [Armatimonadota bacterium]
MLLVVQTGNGDIIERMWRLVVSARKNDDSPLMWRLTEDILDAVQAFYQLGRDAVAPSDVADRELRAAPGRVERFLDVPVDPTTTMPHLLCRPDVVYHL